MISETDKARIIELGRKYGVKRILLFGSSASRAAHSKDIDLAVEGVSAALFFRFYGELMSTLSKPVDLVDLGRKTLFTDLISRDSVTLYG